MDAELKEYLEAMEARINERFDKMQAENNCWHEKTYRLQVGLESRVNSLEDRVSALEKGY